MANTSTRALYKTRVMCYSKVYGIRNNRVSDTPVYKKTASICFRYVRNRF